MSSVTLALYCALIGLCCGTVTVWAAPRLARGRTKETLINAPWQVLIPIVGIALTRFRVVRNLSTECACAALFALLSLHLGRQPQLVTAMCYVMVLVAVAYIDADYRLVLNRLTVPAALLALAGSPLWPGIGPLSSLLGALSALALFGTLQVVGRGAMGTGDTKLAVVIGAMRGFPGVFNALFLGVLIGGLGALFLLLFLRRSRKDSFAYAPFLAAGAILSMFLPSP